MLQRPKVVVGVLVKNANKYLLVKEAMESGRDCWIVPGGKVEFGEELETAARREIQEETGIVTKKLKFLCFKEAVYPQFNYHTVIFFYLAKTTVTKLEKDIEGKVQEARWFTKGEINKLDLVESAKWLFDKLDSGK